MVQIVKEEAFDPVGYTRHSDNCTNQFKSRNTVRNLNDIQEEVSPNLKYGCFQFFEAHEGKNLSDCIGGIGKQAYARSSVRKRGSVDGAGDADNAADQPMVIAEQMKAGIEEGLSFVDGRVGNFSFFR